MQTDPQYKLRLPADLKEKIKKASEENHRSMNAEIVARLEESFGEALVLDGDAAPSDGDFSADDVIAMYRELDTAMKNIRRLRASREKFLNRHDSKNEKRGGSGKVDIEDDLLK